MWPLQNKLQNGIWHTTHPDRFESIMKEGLKPEPDIPNNDRWKTSHGPEYYPFVRKIGGISLFDFRNFNPDIYGSTHPMSDWNEFVPHRKEWTGAVWIQINQSMLGNSFVSSDEIVRQWDSCGNRQHTIMPRIECACIGHVPISAFKFAFMTWEMGSETHEISLESFSESKYQEILQAWRQSITSND